VLDDNPRVGEIDVVGDLAPRTQDKPAYLTFARPPAARNVMTPSRSGEPFFATA
jgi:hypothetical protein